MCGRYTLMTSRHPETQKWGLSPTDRFNIAPQSDVLIQLETGNPQLRRWDYSPNWARPSLHISNARSETLLQKNAFKNTGRCVFFADGWYEWQRVGEHKSPWYHHGDGRLLLFAGIYGQQSGCAMVTARSQAAIAHIHHRQPLLLTEGTMGAWLDGANPETCMHSVPVECYPVSQRVNRVTIDEPSLIEPLEENAAASPRGQTIDFFRQ